MTHDIPPKRIWTFDRYVNGILMAEGVEIEKAETFEQAAKAAVRLASSGPKGEAPVLVLRDTSEVEAMVAAALREAARVAVEVAFDYWEETKKPVEQRKHGSKGLPACVAAEIKALIPQPASASLDKLIAEAEARGRIVGLEEARSTANLNAWCHKGDDARSQGMDAGARHQLQVIHDALSDAIRAAKGDQT